MEPVNSLRIGLAVPGRRRRPPWVPPLIAAAIAVLLGGLWEGLVYMGLSLPAGSGTMSEDHGQLMVLGFLGTLIALERAVALGETWGYLAPMAAGAGGLAIIAGAPGDVGEALICCGGLVLVAIFAAVYRIQPSLHNAVLASAAVCWVVAAGLWLVGKIWVIVLPVLLALLFSSVLWPLVDWARRRGWPSALAASTRAP